MQACLQGYSMLGYIILPYNKGEINHDFLEEAGFHLAYYSSNEEIFTILPAHTLLMDLPNEVKKKN